ncbi:PB1 domain, RWP-RK domain, lambda repressor-like, DNA-binding domain protein [Tanacetum coccineum]
MSPAFIRLEAKKSIAPRKLSTYLEMISDAIVIVKAAYKNDTTSFLFQLPTQTTNRSSERFIKLNEEIAIKFRLQLGSFKLKYQDPDGDMIMITCDDSLSLSAEDFTVPGLQTVIKLVVLPA